MVRFDPPFIFHISVAAFLECRASVSVFYDSSRLFFFFSLRTLLEACSAVTRRKIFFFSHPSSFPQFPEITTVLYALVSRCSIMAVY